MEDLKKGDLVWSKEHGRGIVTNPQSRAPYQKGHTNYSAIWFENTLRAIRVHRKELFVKGDKVQIKTGNSYGWIRNETFSFYEPMLHNPNCDSAYTIKPKNCTKVKYARDVRHVTETVIFDEEQKLLDKVIDKTLTNHPITPIDISRTVFRAGQLSDIGVKADKVLKDKVYKEVYSQPELDFDPYADYKARAKVYSPRDEKAELLKRIEILELQARIRELES